MLHTAKTLKGYTLDSLDGQLGEVNEFYFDDWHWTVRHLVANTGHWPTGRQVLISPQSLIAAIKDQQHIAVDLYRKQIEESPSLVRDKPVSRQFEDFYNRYFGYSMQSGGPYMWGYYPYIALDCEQWETASNNKSAWDPHLRSTNAVSGHTIQATDGEIGHVEDFVIDDETWAICYLIVTMGSWWSSGKKVLISPQWIERISSKESKVFLSLSCDAIEHSPEFTEQSLYTRDDEKGLHRHYERPSYWMKETPAKVHSQ